MPKSAKMVFALHAPIVVRNCQTEGVVTYFIEANSLKKHVAVF